MIANTPPMGWNSWDCYGAEVDEATVRRNAEYMARNLKAFGWEYIVVDIQWSAANAAGHVYEAFPDRGEPLSQRQGRQGFPSTGGLCPFPGAEVRHPYHAGHAPGRRPQKTAH